MRAHLQVPRSTHGPLCSLRWRKTVSEYLSENSTITTRHREEEPHNNRETPGRQTKENKQLSLLHQDDCKTRVNIN